MGHRAISWLRSSFIPQESETSVAVAVAVVNSSGSGSDSSSGDPKPRPVKCDVWRVWSQKKGNAAFHQMAMKEIAAYYKQNVLPELRSVKLKTDGQRSQFKGHKNLCEVPC